jgi:hypothetical protein
MTYVNLESSPTQNTTSLQPPAPIQSKSQQIFSIVEKIALGALSGAEVIGEEWGSNNHVKAAADGIGAATATEVQAETDPVKQQDIAEAGSLAQTIANLIVMFRQKPQQQQKS